MSAQAQQTLLVAVDGSPTSLAGLDFALPIARGTGAAIELVYVSPPMLLPPTVYEQTIKEIEAAEQAHGDAILAEAAKRVTDVPCTRVRLSGPAAECIADHAQGPRFTTVVVGSKAHNAVSRVMLGSVADRLCHICPCPVLVVRTPT